MQIIQCKQQFVKNQSYKYVATYEMNVCFIFCPTPSSTSAYIFFIFNKRKIQAEVYICMHFSF